MYLNMKNVNQIDLLILSYRGFQFLQLLITLRYLAKGDFFSEIADLHGVSRSSVCRSIKQVDILSC